jgi:hypothetical protein
MSKFSNKSLVLDQFCSERALFKKAFTENYAELRQDK